LLVASELTLWPSWPDATRESARHDDQGECRQKIVEVPSENDVAGWVAQAKELPKVVAF
jgi:hypothetical protein